MFRSEEELYHRVAEWTKPGRVITDEFGEYGRTLYVAGEDHHAAEAVEHVHWKIVPLVHEVPDRWLMLREGLHAYEGFDEDNSDLLQKHPVHFYFSRLPALLGIPAEDPIGRILDNTTREGVMELSGLSEQELDLWYAHGFLHTNRDLGREEAIVALTGKLNKPASYVFDLPWFYSDKRRLHERLMTAWNRLGRIRLLALLENYPGKDNVLVSAGTAHLPAFSDRFTYIG